MNEVLAELNCALSWILDISTLIQSVLVCYLVLYH